MLDVRGLSDTEVPRHSRPAKQQPSTVVERTPAHFIDVQIPVSESIVLEGLLKIPNPMQTYPVNKLVILSHPWSWLGGCMQDP